MSPRVRGLARRLILATSVPPFLQLYRAGYAVATHLAVRLFRRFPEIRAVYLRRGASKGEIIPLVSDLDFAVVGGPLGPEEERELHRAYGRLARATSLLDDTLEIFDEETFAARYRRSPHYRYRFTEGRETWKLLYGRDVLRELPELGLEELRGGCFAEVQIWWMLFAWRLLQRRRYHAERVTRNSLCYKAVAELLKIGLAFREERLVFHRSDALDLARGTLDAADAALVEELRVAARKRFRAEVPRVLERTTAFLLRHGRELCDDFASLEAAGGAVPHVVEAAPGELLHDRPLHEQLARLTDLVDRTWPDARRVAAVPGIGFNVDEVLLVIEMAAGALPDAERLAELYAAHRAADVGPVAGRVHPFVHTGGAAFQLDGTDLQKSWQALLCPAANPDVFELLARPSATLLDRGGPRDAPRHEPATGPHARHFLEEEHRLFAELLDEPAVYRVPGLEFQRVFWKTAQLAVAREAEREGRLHYALTLPAIERGLERLGAPLPEPLRALAPAYLSELVGRPTDVGEIVPAAVGYLRELVAGPAVAGSAPGTAGA